MTRERDPTDPDETYFAFDEDRPQALAGEPSAAVIEAVAEVNGVEATDLPPLQRTVDADALDALVSTGQQRADGAVNVTFTYADTKVWVAGHGITVRPDSS